MMAEEVILLNYNFSFDITVLLRISHKEKNRKFIKKKGKLI